MILATAFPAGYDLRVAAKSAAGISSPVLQADTPPNERFFCVRRMASPSNGRAVREGYALPDPVPGLLTRTVPSTRLAAGGGVQYRCTGLSSCSSKPGWPARARIAPWPEPPCSLIPLSPSAFGNTASTWKPPAAWKLRGCVVDKPILQHYDTLTLATERLQYVEAVAWGLIQTLPAKSPVEPHEITHARTLAHLIVSQTDEWKTHFRADAEGLEPLLAGGGAR